MPQRCEALSLYILWKGLQRHLRLEKTHKNSYRWIWNTVRKLAWQSIYTFYFIHIQLFRSSTLQVQSLWKIFHPTLFTRKPLPKSARGGSSVRLQAKEVKGKREDESNWRKDWRRKPFRCTSARIAVTPPLSRRFTIFTWRTTIPIHRRFSSSMISGISNSTTQSKFAFQILD